MMEGGGVGVGRPAHRDSCTAGGRRQHDEGLAVFVLCRWWRGGVRRVNV